MRVLRKIIQIDEDLCNGCGQCIPACKEGAIAIVNGKAKIIAEKFCDGLGDCIGECPTGALTIIEKEAEEFDPNAVTRRQTTPPQKTQVLPSSGLTTWPVKLKLLPPQAKFLDRAHLLIAGDCVPVALPDFHTYLEDKVVLIACPKFDNKQEYVHKLSEIFSKHLIESVTILEMEVPCCAGLHQIVLKAKAKANKTLAIKRWIISKTGIKKAGQIPKLIL